MPLVWVHDGSYLYHGYSIENGIVIRYMSGSIAPQIHFVLYVDTHTSAFKVLY